MLAPLLLAAAPFVGPEVTWRVTSPQQTYFPAQQAAPVAADRAGYAVAWSEVAGGISRACAGTLTVSGHIDRVGICTSGTGDASAIVPYGDGYVMAWLEPEALDARPNLITGALDRDFHLRGSQLVGLTANAPVLHAGGSRLWMDTTRTLYELDAAGAVRNATDFSPIPESVAMSGDQAGYVWHGRQSGFLELHTPRPPIITIYFARLGGTTSTFQFDQTDERNIVATGASSEGFLVLWTQSGSLKASFFGAGFDRQAAVASVAGLISPLQVASDGRHWLVVWSYASSIWAVAIAPDLSATTFPIAGGARPAVVASSPGRFLVTYEVFGFGQRRLASRVIDFDPPTPRMRVVR